MSYTIDHDVPIPPRKGRTPKAAWRTFPFDRMKVGDSFFSGGISTAVQSAAKAFAFNHRSVKFCVRTFDSDPRTNLPGTRVWRIE